MGGKFPHFKEDSGFHRRLRRPQQGLGGGGSSPHEPALKKRVDSGTEHDSSNPRAKERIFFG